MGPLDNRQRDRCSQRGAVGRAGDNAGATPINRKLGTGAQRGGTAQPNQRLRYLVVGNLAGDDLLTSVAAFAIRAGPRQTRFERIVVTSQFVAGQRTAQLDPTRMVGRGVVEERRACRG